MVMTPRQRFIKHLDPNAPVYSDKDISPLGYNAFVNFGVFFVAVELMTFGKGRLHYCETLDGSANCWCYSTAKAAGIAMVTWNPFTEDEPLGWFRNPLDGRRREDGDPEKETIRQ